MATFSESSFAKKLADLNSSQQSIQTISLWLIHHRKHSKKIVEIWYKELKKAKPPKRLTFLYLANDVIQNSKKKGPEFHKAFREALPDAYKHASREADEKIKGSMERMLAIWKERGVFDEDFIQSVKKNMKKAAASKKSDKEAEKKPKIKSKPVETTNAEPPPKKKKKKSPELSLREEIEAEISQGILDPPEPDVLMQALQELENSASSDASVRERIAALPPEVSDVSLLEKLKDKAEAEQLVLTVEDACSLLTDYNGRLAAELEERRHVARMLRDFIHLQKEALTMSEQKYEENKTKLEGLASVRKELKAHLQSLPDLTLLPDVTGGLAPLPTAGDLFATEGQ